MKVWLVRVEADDTYAGYPDVHDIFASEQAAQKAMAAVQAAGDRNEAHIEEWDVRT